MARSFDSQTQAAVSVLPSQNGIWPSFFMSQLEGAKRIFKRGVFLLYNRCNLHVYNFPSIFSGEFQRYFS
jgi:hypothetical protein